MDEDKFIMPIPAEIQVFHDPIINNKSLRGWINTSVIGEPVICPNRGESIETTTAIFFRDMDGSIRKEDKNG